MFAIFYDYRFPPSRKLMWITSVCILRDFLAAKNTINHLPLQPLLPLLVWGLPPSLSYATMGPSKTQSKTTFSLQPAISLLETYQHPVELSPRCKILTNWSPLNPWIIYWVLLRYQTVLEVSEKQIIEFRSPHLEVHLWAPGLSTYLSVCLSVCLSVYFFRATLAAYVSSQAGGWIGAAAAGLHYSHSNAGSELHLQPTP